MPLKLGNGGYGPEEYNEHDGKYKTDGVPNKSYDNPNEKILNVMGLKPEENQGKKFGFSRKQLPYWGSKIIKKYNIESPFDIVMGWVDNYEELTNESNDIAKKLLQEETGYSEQETTQLFNCMIDFFGGKYSDYRNGLKPNETEIINNGLKRMANYSGNIYRGMSFSREKPEEVAMFEEFLNNLQIGNTLNMKGLSSWTSKKNIARGYAGDYKGEQDDELYHSIILVVKNNKTGVGVQHISKFGDGESEVLMPSTSKWKVINKKIGARNGKQIVVAELEEI